MFEVQKNFINDFGYYFSIKYYFYKNARLRKYYLNLISNYLENNYQDCLNICLNNKNVEKVIKKENYKI